MIIEYINLLLNRIKLENDIELGIRGFFLIIFYIGNLLFMWINLL